MKHAAVIRTPQATPAHHRTNDVASIKRRTRLPLNWSCALLNQSGRSLPYPGQCLVAALLDDLEVSDLDAAHREIRNLEFHLKDRYYPCHIERTATTENRYFVYFCLISATIRAINSKGSRQRTCEGTTMVGSNEIQDWHCLAEARLTL